MKKKLKVSGSLHFGRPVQMLLIWLVFLLPAGILLSGWIGLPSPSGSGETWDPLRWSNKSSRSPATAAAMEAQVEAVMEVFRKAAPLNPPKGFGVNPRGEFLPEIRLPGHSPVPEPVRLRLGIRKPPGSQYIVATLNAWINDPYHLLGEAVLSDPEGEIFLMPPVVGRMGGQTIYTRTAHPVGYEEKYPSRDMFPLWSEDMEPFLRSVVRPTFKLAHSSVTTLFTAGGKPFWKPVSQERWIRALIAKARKDLDDFQTGLEEAEKTDITAQQIAQMRQHLQRMKSMLDEKEIVERHAESLEQAMSLYEMMKDMNPEQAEEYYRQTIAGSEEQLQEKLDAAGEQRTELEKYEQRLIGALVKRDDVWTGAGASISSGNWDRLEQLGRENHVDHLVFLADAGRAIGKLEAELAGLSPSQRSAPAYGFELPPFNPLGPHGHVVMMPFEAERPSGLVDPGAEGARALVCLDPEFFRSGAQEAVVRILSVDWRGSHDLSYHNNQKNLPQDLWQSIDWAALRAFVQ